MESLRQLHALLEAFGRCNPGPVARSAMKLMIMQEASQPAAKAWGLQPGMLREALGLDPSFDSDLAPVKDFLERALAAVRCLFRLAPGLLDWHCVIMLPACCCCYCYCPPVDAAGAEAACVPAAALVTQSMLREQKQLASLLLLLPALLS